MKKDQTFCTCMSGKVVCDCQFETISSDSTSPPPIQSEPLIGDGKYTITDWAKMHVDTCYEPSSDFDRDCMIKCVEVGYNAYANNLENIAEHQARQQPVKNPRLEERRKTISQEVKDSIDAWQPVRKTLQECKDEVARGMGYSGWNFLLSNTVNDPDPNPVGRLDSAFDTVAELYASLAKLVQPVRKTLDEVKDEVARELGYTTWKAISNWCSLVPTMESYCDKVSQRYLTSNQVIEPPTQTNN